MDSANPRTFTFELPKELRKLLTEKAEAQGRSVGSLIRHHLRDLFAKNTKPKKPARLGKSLIHQSGRETKQTGGRR